MIQGRRYRFGVSGRVYKSNLLFYDYETDSLWSQLLSQAVTGPLTGTRLAWLPAQNTTWGAWKTEHPETLVMSFPAGSGFDYKQDPYAAYPLVRNPALVISAGGATKIYPLDELKQQASQTGGRVLDQVDGHTVTIVYERRANSARVQTDHPSVIIYFQAFLDDARAFYPAAGIYHASHR
jgi:Protein of unknown function (DUF3179)